MSKRVKIRKYSGELEVFDIGKLINSLRRSKADEELVQEIASAIGNTVTDGMTTKEMAQRLRDQYGWKRNAAYEAVLAALGDED